MPIKENKVFDTSTVIPSVPTEPIKEQLMKPKITTINYILGEYGTIELNENKSILIENYILKKKFHIKSTHYINDDETVALMLPA
jgi:hypothetical protein